MRFSKSDNNIYKITGLTDDDRNQILNFCYLGVCFDNKSKIENTIQIKYGNIF